MAVATTFRGKLLAIVAASAITFVLLIGAGTLTERQVTRQLAIIEARYVPKLEVGPRLEGQLDRLVRGFTDAVASQDADALAATRGLITHFEELLSSANDAIDPADAAALRTAVEDYYSAAHEVSRRLIAGEKGEPVVEAMSALQSKHARAQDLLSKAIAFDKGQLSEAFQVASRSQEAAARIRLAVSLVCLGLVAGLSLWLGRGAVRSLAELTAGVKRFGQGDFDHPIAVKSNDELGEVARHTNEMAASLKRLGEERDRDDWVKNGEAGLAHELRGDLDPREVSGRATRFLARYVGSPVAALYYAAEDGILTLTGQYALGNQTGQPVPRFAPGEGLIGQAALAEDLVVVDDPPADYLKVRSGLGESAPRAVVMTPLVHLGRVTGVLELGVFKAWPDRATDLLASVRETLAIAIEVARARAALRELLNETQHQAERLKSQEEELRATNEELHAQQAELRQTNDQLALRARELEVQRQALQAKNTELDEARRHLEQKAEELAAVSTYKSQFLANMSHELRTPLNSMLLLSNLMSQNESGNLTAKQVEFSRTIYGAGKDLLALINQVLDLAKVESGKQEVRIEPVSLADVAEQLEPMFGPLAREKGLTLVVEVAEGLPATIATDRQRLDQILRNLLGNAIKFTREGQVTVRVGRPASAAELHRPDLRPDRTVAVSVSDTGIGIAPELQQRVFEPFEQVEARSDRRYGGTGLGLTIARELAGLLGGELRLDSRPGVGSTFTCYLPTDGPRPTASALPAVPPPVPRPVNDDRRGLGPEEDYLLIVEDDPVFADAFGEVIHSQGQKYLVAPDGQTGIRLARERRPRGIILDVRLPDMEGWTVMEQLRADAATASIPVHFVSAAEGGERGMAMGAVGYLTKPASRLDLVRVLDSLSPRKSACKFLVVEDDPQSADSLMQRMRAEGMEAEQVGTAADALERLGRETFGCVVLDLSLPDMDGLALLETIEQRKGAEAPPVVVYTGRALSKAEAKRLEAYTEAVVLKDGASGERLVDELRLFVRRLDQGRTRRKVAVASAAPQSLEGRRVLVADDDMRTVYALSAMLRAKGMEVLVADNGVAALAMLGDHPQIEVVLLDIMMPEMDGYEVLRRLRADARLRDLPVIALTAKAMKGDAERCLAAGATDYLPKPIDPDRLLSALAAHLDLRAQDGAAGRA
jgi:signal transduction histidine kinase/CheY-like chemotaxis protein/HAMP domain-containing protein